MRPCLSLILSAALFGWGIADASLAQSTGGNSGGFGGTGGNNAGSSGGNTSGSSSGRTSGGNTFGNSSTGAGSSTGSSGSSSSGSGAGVSSLNGGMAIPDQSGFVGGANAGTFVGNQNARQQTVNAGTTSRFSGFGGNLGTITPQNTSQARGGQMRVSQRIVMGTASTPPQVIQQSLQSQFATLTQRLPGVVPQVEAGGLVTLEGTVADTDTARLAEALALTEPGVLRVQNNLVVPAVPAPVAP